MTPNEPMKMNEKSIIFNSEMVKAILEDRKAMTRRVVNYPAVPNKDIVSFQEFLNVPKSTIENYPKEGYYALLKCNANQDNRTIYFKCPYGQPGDRLWVKETWANVLLKPLFLKADNIALPEGIHWRPSIHMPRWASRITLEITDVRVERLQEITRSDIRAEGLVVPKEYCSDDIEYNYRQWLGDEWKEIWDSLYTKKPEYQWDANPWVFVISFKDISNK